MKKSKVKPSKPKRIKIADRLAHGLAAKTKNQFIHMQIADGAIALFHRIGLLEKEVAKLRKKK